MEETTVTMQELFKFEVASIEPDGRIDGGLATTGLTPSFAERFTRAGIALESFLPNIARWA